MPDSKCSSCGAAIRFVRTASGKAMPVDLPAQSRFVLEDGAAVLRDTYVSHFTTCPNAAQHRKPRRATNA